MSINLSALKKSSSSDLLAKLKKGIEESSSKGSSREKDTRFWGPTIDEAGNGSATIRFLPAKTEDDFPFVKLHNHAFQENGLWFIKECPSTIGQACPVCEDNRTLWNSGNESDKELARKHKRQTKYVANVLIIKDPANPEFDGQIKLFRFGKKIYDKLIESMSGDEDLGEQPVNPFSFFDGANFVIRTQTVGGYLNYDKCKVVPVADLHGGDEEKLTAVMESMYDLKAFTDPSVFESYDAIKARFLKVTGGAQGEANAIASAPKEKYDSAPKETPIPTKQKEDVADVASSDEDLDFFRNLLDK